MTAEEKTFMKKVSKITPVDDPGDSATKKRMTAQEWGREGMRRRWGDHGKTKCVRAFEKTVDRFRAAIPNERDRAAAATAALDAYLDGRDVPAKASGATVPVRVVTPDGKGITINAVLTYHWYDEIKAGRKRTEYREIGSYWDERLWSPAVRGRIAAIRFSRGYTNERMTWEVTRIDRNEADGVYEIHLGKKIL